MPNPLYGMMGGNNTPSIAQLLQQLKANPMAVLSKRFNLPQGMSGNDPNAILNHLVQTGQVSQDRVNAAYQQAQKMGLK